MMNDRAKRALKCAGELAAAIGITIIVPESLLPAAFYGATKLLRH